MLISFTMICSCQKQDSATEAQLAQRKTELDAREQTLDQREKELALRETVLNERERALAKKEKAIANAGKIPDAAQLKAERDRSIQQPPPEVQDPAQMKAEKERKMRQVPPEVQSLIPNASQVQAQRDRTIQQLLDQRQRTLKESQRTQPQMQNKGAMSDAERMKIEAEKQAAIPAFTGAPAAVYPGAEATSPSPSPTPQ